MLRHSIIARIQNTLRYRIVKRAQSCEEASKCAKAGHLGKSGNIFDQYPSRNNLPDKPSEGTKESRVMSANKASSLLTKRSARGTPCK
jgi:hypothetical protein